MSKPVLLSGGNGKVSELAGTESRQVLTWTSAEEWAPGPGVGGSGGGGELFYLNELTSPDSPVVNIPTGASGTTVKELGTSANGTGSTVSSTSSVPVSPNAPEIIAGFVTDLSVPNATEIPAGLWEFNVWAEATGNTTNQSFIQAKVYKYNGVNAPTAIATSASVYLYDPGDVTQYTLSVLIPGGVTLLATDRIYVEILGGSTTSNRQITLSFGNSTPSHVHTTIFIPINLGTDVTGTLPVANGGTGVTSASANTVFAGPTTGSAAAPSFRSLVADDVPSLSSVYLPLSGGTLTGKLITPASTTATAGFNLPHGVAPTSPVDGDIWTTTTAIQARLNTVTITLPLLAASQTFTGNNTFTASSNIFGNNTFSSTTSLSTGATVSGSTKTVNIGTNGLSGSTTTITIGGTAGTSTTTLNGTVNATTAPVDTNSTRVATTAYVVGQGYAKLASPTFSGTPSLPTGTTGVTQSAGNNTTALATTAFVAAAVAASSGIPYDLPCEIPGTPDTSKRVVNLKAVRAFNLSSTGHQGGQLTNPTAPFICPVLKNGVSIGNITFAAGGFSHSITATAFAVGDVLSVETPSAALGIDTPFATFFMTLA
jgi:hypothetical protein